jgi:hypothetical protein
MNDVEVDIKSDSGKAVIEGKTSVPLKTFVTLILQRKVQTLFKKWQDEPVIVTSEMLTALASAPSDRQEDRGKLTLVTFGVGVVGGAFFTLLVFGGLLMIDIRPELKDIGIALGIIALVAGLVIMLQRGQKKSGFTEQLHESMEKITDLVAR